MNEAYLFNPRNCYQNYNCAVNLSDRMIYTYMGVLKPGLGNANYCSAGVLSPLLKDPYYRTIGVGTRIFLGGGVGYVTWQGTQHSPDARRLPHGAPAVPAGTIAVTGDLKQMTPEYLVGVSFQGYGVSLAVGVGVPIPVLDEEVMAHAARGDDELVAQVVDYSHDYPEMVARSLGEVSYQQLRSGAITVQGREVPTVSLSSFAKARAIAAPLEEWIGAGRFLLTEPVTPLPTAGAGIALRPLHDRAKKH